MMKKGVGNGGNISQGSGSLPPDHPGLLCGQKVENPYQRAGLPVIVTLVIARWMCYNGRCYDAFRMVGTK